MTKNKKKSRKQELDGVFVLKIALYVILGSLWLKVGKTGSEWAFPLPIGAAVGLLFTSHEHFRIDRKIEYAVLIIAALFGFLAPYGLYVSF
ncbi:MAG: hypothetical protein WC498_01575 [Candidatus Saccharimonadales bacterium]